MRSSVPAPALLLFSAPAVFSGVLAMRFHGIDANLWGQNLAVWTIGTLCCLWSAMIQCVFNSRSASAKTIAYATIGSLIATLIFSGINGVHRWVFLGPIRLHAASIL